MWFPNPGHSCPLVAILAIVSREPGQALTGAAISGVALCEGRLQRASLNDFVESFATGLKSRSNGVTN